MEDAAKTTEQLLEELQQLRNKLNEFEQNAGQSQPTLLGQSNMYHLLAQNLANGALFLFDHDLRYFVAEGKDITSVGLSRAQIEGKTIWEVWPPEIYDLIEPAFRAALLGEESEIEVPYQNQLYIFYTLPVKTSQGVVLAGMAMSQDITKYKRAEEALRKRQAELEAIVDNSPTLIYIKDIEGRYVLVNRFCEMMLGKTRQEILGKTDYEVFPPAVAQRLEENDRRVLAAGKALELEERVPQEDGEHIFISVKFPIYDLGETPYLLCGISTDITERKRIEQRLEASEAKFRQLAETVDAAIALFQGNKYSYVNPAFQRLTGYNEQESLAMNFWEIAHPEYQSIIKERGLARQRGEDAPSRYECRIVRKNGEQRWVEARMSITRLEGQSAGLGTFVDITLRKQVEAELTKQREQLAVILQSIEDGVILTNMSGEVTLLSSVAQELTGWPQSDAAGQPIAQIFQVVSRRTGLVVRNSVAAVLETGQMTSLPAGSVLVARNGTQHPIADSAAPIRDKLSGNPLGVVLVFRDISNEEHIEEELIKAHKLDTLQILAGGLAHDFNNLLTALVGNIGLAKLELAVEQIEAQQLLDEAENAAFRAKNFTEQLFSLTRSGPLQKKATSLRVILEEATRFALRGSNVRSQFQIANELWSVEVDEGQINQVVHNLVINAQQAMPSGGIITVKAENIPARAVETTGVALQARDYVKVSVQDEGIGIPEQILSRIFDPYFTTKQKGSGLGLAMTASIIQKHGGQISVQSKMSQGTTFFIYLPALVTVGG